MRKIVTDKPTDNVSTALNLFYVDPEDGMTWVYGGGAAPDYPDVTLPEWMRQIIKKHDIDLGANKREELSDEDIDMLMAELLMDGTDTIEGVLATLYTAGWAFSEIREHLAQYERAESDSRLIALPCKIGDIMWCVRCYRGVYKTQSGRVSDMLFVPGKSRDDPMTLQIVVKHVGRGEFGKDVFDNPDECNKECERRNRDGQT